MAAPYRARIVEFCHGNGIVVPSNFDVPQSTEKLVLVDDSTSSPTLFYRSTYQKKELLAWGQELVGQGKKVRFFDLKRQCELVLDERGKLMRGAAIDALSAEERRQLEWRNCNEV